MSIGAKLGGPSRRELRRRDAQGLKGLAGQELRAAVGETTWTSPQEWSSTLFWGFALVCLWLVAWDCLWWAFTGKQQIFDADTPPGPVGWVAIVFLSAVAVVVTAAVLPILFQRPWVRLDSTGITHRDYSILWRSPAVYRWAECGPIRLRHVPSSEDGSICVVECTHRHGTLTLDRQFGDPGDLATILIAYRKVYRSTDPDPVAADAELSGRSKLSSAMLRSREAQRLDGLTGPALRQALGVSTWTTSRDRGYLGLLVITACGGTMAALFAMSTGTADTATRIGIVGIFVFIGGAFAWFLFSVLNPPWVRLDPSGITVGGAQPMRPSTKPKVYRWEECGPFSVRTISGENARTVARCTHRQRELAFESAFGSPLDLVTILNAYRSAYRNTDLRR